MKSTTKIIILAVVLYCLGCVYSQQVGTNQAEVHPPIGTYYCTKNGCAQQAKSIVLDANWRWTHKVGGSDNCYTGDMWDKTACPDGVTCAKNCAIDGADYPGTYGIVASGNSVTLKFVTHGPYSTNIGSRVYLLRDDNNYEMFQLLGKEFTFDVDVSNLPCGLNGALYFVEMSQDGGKGKFPGNVAGAKYGTGYCDAQCPHDLKWINGEANCEDWQPAPDDPNSGIGKYGTCCSEMDIWEANKISEAYTAHPCTVQGQTRCMGTQCGDGDNRYGGVCDKDGCDFNAYRLGVKDYYGPSNTIDTTKKITVVTQFITKDGTANTDLSEIRRIWVQDGKVMANAATKIPNVRGYNTITDQFCTDVKTVFGDKNDFAAKGGLRGFGGALKRGVVLVMSLWDDHAAHMLWLDSNYPTSADPSKPGIARGTCSTSSGVPDDVQNQYPNSSVTFSNIKSGDLNTTFSAKW